VARIALFAIVAVAVITIGTQLFHLLLSHRTGQSSETMEYVTANGQRATIHLRDGTRVVLNVASRLHIPKDFGITTRVVTLEGEAQFSVTHDEAHPFVVHANGSVIRDISTAFDVRAYAGTGATSVTVREGRVAVQAPRGTPGTAVIVDAMHRATVGSDGTTQVIAVSDIESDFGWAEGRLVFRLTPVGEAFTQLSRWYNLDFRVADSSLLDMHLSAVLPDTLTQAGLNDIASALDCRIQRAGRVVTFTPLHNH
jgi:ferric-dicitrate binding protein FerR (iron transport regulator)